MPLIIVDTENMTQLFLGVDVGSSSGAFAIITNEFKVLCLKDFTGWPDFYGIVSKSVENIKFAALEHVFIWPGAAAKASTSFMKNAGAFEALLEVMGIPRELIVPQKWQKVILGALNKPVTKGLPTAEANKIKRDHKKRIKEISLLKATQRFGIELKESEHGKADALNLALYAMKFYQGQI